MHDALAGSVPKVGYFPPTFPRDPTHVNIYLEHMLLGQIIEPLIETGSDGSLIPGLAARWEVSEYGKKIRFYIRKGLTFSNGRSVSARDAVFSLQRHISSAHSQSRAYLRRISSIKAVSEYELEIGLTEPYVAIFKALSRDQLGIVPADWTFDSESTEPFIGTGPYRVIGKRGQWRLVRNAHYRAVKDVAIPEWELLFYGAKQQPPGDLPIPDLVPMVSAQTAKAIQESPERKRELKSTNLVHFLQSSAWYCPHGQHFGDLLFRRRSMSAVQALFREAIRKYGFASASGVIPQGISGYLDSVPLPEKPTPSLQEIKITVSVLPNLMRHFCDSENVRKVEAEHNVKFKFVEQPDDDPAIVTQRPDILVTSYAGGFQDPEGFLTIISAFLQAEPKDFLGSSYPDYVSASTELSWSKRSQLYRKLNANLVNEQVMVPGWRPDLFRLTWQDLDHKQDQLRYTLKLKDFSVVPRKEANHGD